LDANGAAEVAVEWLTGDAAACGTTGTTERTGEDPMRRVVAIICGVIAFALLYAGLAFATHALGTTETDRASLSLSRVVVADAARMAPSEHPPLA
jgi:hypothetical protein